jgi:hypothetical protein
MAAVLVAAFVACWAPAPVALVASANDTPNRFPETGAIIVWAGPNAAGMPEGLRAICSGALIHERVFLTSGHCIGPGVRGIPPFVQLNDYWGTWSLPSRLCRGDSGAPTFVDDVREKRGRRLVAVVSNGGKDCASTDARVRVDTAAMQEWIARVIHDEVAQHNSASVAGREASGRFQFIDPGTNHPISVWFCRASAIASDTRIVFIMHGSEPQTARQACDIASPYLQAHKAIVLAPQFGEEFYPGDAYMFGNMVDSAGRLLPQSAWAFGAIEELFNLVSAELGLSQTQYDIVGFSGGGQFVHRLALFAPDARFRRAVVASAGRYALPSWEERFPYGLAGSPIERKMLPAVFSRELVLLLGDQDVTDREREAASMAQGKTRFARGLRFFAAAVDEAAALGVSLRWRLRLVPGVDHSAVFMVRAALDELDK